MNFYYTEYFSSKTKGISKKDWEEYGHQSLHMLLKSFGIPETLNVDQFLKIFSYWELDKGERLISEGVKNPKLYFVISGTVRYYTTVGNVEVTKALLSEGNIVTATSFVSKEVSKISVVACSKLRVLVLNHEDLQFLLENGWEEIINTVIWNIYNKGIDFSNNISTIYHLPGSERLLRLYNLYPEMLFRFSSKNISSLLGMKPSTYSRLKAKVLNS